MGDVVLLHWDDEIPADVVMIRTSDERGLAYVETATHGETNLKVKIAAPPPERAFVRGGDEGEEEKTGLEREDES